MKERLAAYMLQSGYVILPTNLREFMVFIKPEFSFVNVIMAMEIPRDSAFTEEVYLRVRDSASKLLADKGVTDMHIISLLLCEDTEPVIAACANDQFSWVIDTVRCEVFPDETKVEEYYGLKRMLHKFLTAPESYGEIKIGPEGEIILEEEQQDSSPKKEKRKVLLPLSVMILIAINVVAFLIRTFYPDIIFSGAMIPSVMGSWQQWYRFFTALFLHLTVSHIFSNMLMLYLMGELLEKKVGRISFILIYFIAGIGGNICSLVNSLYHGEDLPSVGASGAVFGIIGGLFWQLIVSKGKLEYLNTGKIIILILFILYTGFVGKGIDNAAHIGGLVFGFISSIPLYYITRGLKKHKAGQEVTGHED